MANLQKERDLILERKQLLINTWTDDFEGLFTLGSEIYLYIFKVDPTAKELFPALSMYPGDQWKQSKEFRAQALRFVQVLSNAIKNIRTLDRLDPHLMKIGKAHQKYASRGFKSEHWDLFEEGIRLTMESHLKKRSDLSKEQKTETVEAWRALARYIVAVMKRGFDDHS